MTIEKQLQKVAGANGSLEYMALSEKIEAVEKEMLKLPQVECVVRHHFGPGIYIREVTIPAGTFAVGHYHNFEHMNHFIKGRVIVVNEDKTTTELVAPMVFSSKPGRKVGFILEDMVWHNIYATDETDINILEDTLLTKSDEWVNVNQSDFCKEVAKRHIDREDYKLMLKEVGVTHEVAKQQSENKDDQIPMPLGTHKIKVSESAIDGMGVFATDNIDIDEIIMPARVDGNRTPVGRYTNHSINPNAAMVGVPYGDIFLVAVKPIKGCRGGKDGEEITIDYRQAISETLRIQGA